MSASQDFVTGQVRDGLGIITLNRPDRRNAIGFELAAELVEVTQAMARDDGVRAVLLRGAGATFCVGGDINDMDRGYHEGVPLHHRVAALREVMRASEMLHDMRKPTIAAIHGAAAGGGLALALACDLRIAARGTKITTAFAKIGLAGDFGGTWLLTRLLGSARARELYFLSPLLTAEQALAMGLVTRLAEDEGFEAEALAFAHGLAEGPSAVLALMKDSLNQAETADFGAALDVEARSQTLAMLTEDHREAARAFLEKRPAKFTGR